MYNLATSLFFSFAVITAVRALPPPGLYNIVSRVLSGTGQELAVTFNGINTPVTLEPLNSTSGSQIFSLTNFNSVSMNVFPSSGPPNQELGPTSGSAPVIACEVFDTFVFNFSGNSSGFIIGDASANPGTLWFPTTVAVGSQINFSSNFTTNDLRAFWILIPNSG